MEYIVVFLLSIAAISQTVIGCCEKRDTDGGLSVDFHLSIKVPGGKTIEEKNGNCTDEHSKRNITTMIDPLGLTAETSPTTNVPVNMTHIPVTETQSTSSSTTTTTTPSITTPAPTTPVPTTPAPTTPAPTTPAPTTPAPTTPAPTTPAPTTPAPTTPSTTTLPTTPVPTSRTTTPVPTTTTTPKPTTTATPKPTITTTPKPTTTTTPKPTITTTPKPTTTTTPKPTTTATPKPTITTTPKPTTTTTPKPTTTTTPKPTTTTTPKPTTATTPKPTTTTTPKPTTTTTPKPTTTTTPKPTTTTTPKPTTTTTPHCATGWEEFNGNCYLLEYSDEKFKWSAARSKCQSIGADLASIHSLKENVFLAQYAKKGDCTGAWIGLKLNGSYSWSDGTAVDFISADAPVRKPPGVYYIRSACGFEDAKWKDFSMTHVHQSFICKKPLTSTVLATKNKPVHCSIGWRQYNGNCYLLKHPRDEYQRDDARSECQLEGADLASIHSEEENEFLTYYDRASPWIGLEWDGTSHSWSDGSAVDFNMATARGSKPGYYVLYTKLMREGGGRWTEYAIDFPKFAIICKKKLTNGTTSTKPTPSTTTRATTTPSPYYCSTGWKEFNGSCYLRTNDHKEHDWTSARSLCRSMGGDLASIHSQEENDVISVVAACSTTWIGLEHDEAFSWSDGSAVDFVNTAKNDYGDNVYYTMESSCQRVQPGWWSDFPNLGTQMHSICKKSATLTFRAL